MRTSWVVVAAALLTGGIAACSVGPASGPATPAATAPTTPAAAAPAAAAPATAAPVAAPTVTEASGDGKGFGLLKDVRLARQDGADRIVFEFADAVPGYAISYTDLPVTSDPAAQVVPLAGASALQILLKGASAYAANVDTEPAYRVPDRIPRGDATQVTEIVKLGDFERVMVWAAGVGNRTGFRVSTMAAPPRLVVDVM
jgi:hypothetical protein